MRGGNNNRLNHKHKHMNDTSTNNIGRAPVDREFADMLYTGLATYSGDGKQKRASTLMRASAKIL